jgi:hypothetical protein
MILNKIDKIKKQEIQSALKHGVDLSKDVDLVLTEHERQRWVELIRQRHDLSVEKETGARFFSQSPIHSSLNLLVEVIGSDEHGTKVINIYLKEKLSNHELCGLVNEVLIKLESPNKKGFITLDDISEIPILKDIMNSLNKSDVEIDHSKKAFVDHYK